jgi:hypothetical protein
MTSRHVNKEIPRFFDPEGNRVNSNELGRPAGVNIEQQLSQVIFQDLQCTEPLTIEFIQQVLENVRLFDKKQHDYGNANIAAFGEKGVLVRANDKMARLINLSRTCCLVDEKANYESLDDSWRDLSIYGTIALMVRQGVWPN